MTCIRAGVTLVETLIVLVIAGVLLGLVGRTLRHQDALVRLQAGRVAFADALRVTDVVLHGELRWADPVEDVRTLPPDSVRVRAMRAFAVVCGWQGTATLARLHGIRRPNPDKDSVLLVPGGNALALRAAAEAPDACSHGRDEAVYRLALDEPAPRGALLIFERGSYHLTNSAFRYRRGDAGRQPLTAEVLKHARFEPGPATGAAEDLDVYAEPGGAVRAQPADLRVVFANAVPALEPDTARP
jgi:prepilin-type N-terminal cleavage/methylation domain-containing protein